MTRVRGPVTMGTVGISVVAVMVRGRVVEVVIRLMKSCVTSRLAKDVTLVKELIK